MSSEVQSAVRHTRAAEVILHELPGGHRAASTRPGGVGWGSEQAHLAPPGFLPGRS